MKERRKSKRIQLAMSVTYLAGEIAQKRRTADVSTAGFFVTTTELLPVGTTLSFSLSHKELQGSLRVIGRVAHVSEETSLKQESGMGIQIRQIAAGQDELFDSYRKMIEKRIYAL